MRQVMSQNIHHFVRARPSRGIHAGAKGILICGTVIIALLDAMCDPASAAAEVQGQPDNIQLRARNASTKEVLDALSAAFKLTYRLPASVGRDITGIYSGTLYQVLG